MDEIITRWAGDLSTYQKEFQEQAAKVASWDRLLVENGDKIQKLYTSTFEAERASAEVERQLSIVENQQDELAGWLTLFEADVEKMFDERMGESLHQGPDQERERIYKVAEKLTDRLDEMGKDLTNMIQEINTASASLSKTSKTDDPVSFVCKRCCVHLLTDYKLSQIVKVLNGHLSQLQWIDQNAAALQAKVAAAQKASQSIGAGGQVVGENDAADDFYRSYMSRR
jgi:nuclear pore complex protein Nup62